MFCRVLIDLKWVNVVIVEAEESRDSLREDGDRANSHPGSGTLPARYKLLLFLKKKPQ